MSNEFKKVEYMLYNYKNTKAEIKNMRLDLEVLESDYIGVTAQSYDEHTQPTNAFHSDVEDELLKRDEKIIRLRKTIRIKEIEIEKIDNALLTLKDKEQDFIHYKYFDKITHMQISEKLDMSYIYLNEYRVKVINKITRLII